MKLSVQKTIRMAMVFLFFATGLLMNNVARAQEKQILSMTEFTVKIGHEKQFEEGIKAWKACYLENKGEWTWNMWKRLNGKGSVYGMTSLSPTWAKIMDENDPADKKCMQIVKDKIIPHLESTEDNFATTIPEYSKAAIAEMNVIWVSYYKVDNSVSFKEVVKDIADIQQKVEGDKRGYWYSASGGGPESPNYFVVTPYKNFAALDVKRDATWDMVEKVKGKEETEKMRAKIRSSIKNSWMYMYKHMDDLSHNPVK
jgi:hypothetical protein